MLLSVIGSPEVAFSSCRAGANSGMLVEDEVVLQPEGCFSSIFMQQHTMTSIVRRQSVVARMLERRLPSDGPLTQ